jgi:DNA-binding transcriptional ArsR family regulator
MVQFAAVDEVFHALSNSTRRKVLERLSAGPATVSELAAPFDMQLPSFVQHLSVLEQGRLVRSKQRGRVRTYEIAPERFKVVEHWLMRVAGCGKPAWTGSTNTSHDSRRRDQSHEPAIHLQSEARTGRKG